MSFAGPSVKRWFNTVLCAAALKLHEGQPVWRRKCCIEAQRHPGAGVSWVGDGRGLRAPAPGSPRTHSTVPVHLHADCPGQDLRAATPPQHCGATSSDSNRELRLANWPMPGSTEFVKIGVATVIDQSLFCRIDQANLEHGTTLVP